MKTRHLYCLQLFYLIFFGQSATALDTLNVSTDVISNREIQFEYFRDRSKNLTFDQILKSDQWFASTKKEKLSPNKDYVFWIRFNYRSKVNHPSPHLFEIHSTFIKSIELWFLDDSGNVVDTGANSDKDGFSDRGDFQMMNLVHNLPIEGNKVYTCYIRLIHPSPDLLEFKIKPVSKVVNYAVVEYLLLGLYYGILLLFLIYNLFQYTQQKEKIILSYLGMVFFAILISAAEDGIGFQFLWSNAPGLNEVLSYVVAPVGFSVFLTWYFFSFFGFAKSKYGRYIIWACISTNALFIINYLIQQDSVSHYVELAYYSFLYFSVFRKRRKADLTFYLFLVGFTAITFSSIITKIFYLGFIPSGIFAVYIFHFCMVIEAIAFSFALTVKFKRTNDEREEIREKLLSEKEVNLELQEKVNRELEIKVNERTVELNEANQKYAQLNEQLMEMNENLDYQNWKLNKQFEKSTVSLLNGETLDFKSFKELVGSKSDCLELLSELKWSESYKCRKCGNPKFSVLPNKSRKCTTCNGIESPMIGTLVEGVRFPLDKAFYMIYLSSVKADVKHELLAVELEVSSITCSKFRKKADHKHFQFNKEHGDSPKSWKDLLL